VTDALSPEDLAQLRRFGEHFRVCLAPDDWLRVRALHQAGYLERHKQPNPKPPLYRLSEAGWAAIGESSSP
jgi:hypothetical protein